MLRTVCPLPCASRSLLGDRLFRQLSRHACVHEIHLLERCRSWLTYDAHVVLGHNNQALAKLPGGFAPLSYTLGWSLLAFQGCILTPVAPATS